MKKLIISTFLFLIFIFIFSIQVFAGTASSTGTSGGGSGGGGSDSGFKLGQSYSSLGLQWKYGTGDVNWSSSLPLADSSHGINPFTADATEWACVQKYTDSGTYAGWRNMTWKWYYNVALFTSTPKEIGNAFYSDKTYGVWNNNPVLQDAELVKEATGAGFNYNSSKGYYTNSSGVGLDVVWVSKKTVSVTEQKRVMTYAYLRYPNGEQSDDALMTNRDPTRSSSSSGSTVTQDELKDLWAATAITSLPYNGKSLSSNFNDQSPHQTTVAYSYVRIHRTHTYDEDGSGNKSNHKYSNYNIPTDGTGYGSRSIKYVAGADPEVTQTWFRPLDINRSGHVGIDTTTVNTIKAIYPGYNVTTTTKDISGSTERGQAGNIGDPLQALDTNNAIKFRASFGYDKGKGQLGIPKASEGGIDIATSKPTTWPAKSTPQVTGVFSPGGGDASKNVNGDISVPTYWNIDFKGTVNSKKASLVINNGEKVGGDIIVEDNTFTGGYCGFRSTTMGSYNFAGANGIRPFWEAQYEAGRFYGYGVSYSGKITVSFAALASSNDSVTIGDPTINSTNLYSRLNSTVFIQPLVRCNILVKTVAGDKG